MIGYDEFEVEGELVLVSSSDLFLRRCSAGIESDSSDADEKEIFIRSSPGIVDDGVNGVASDSSVIDVFSVVFGERVVYSTESINFPSQIIVFGDVSVEFTVSTLGSSVKFLMDSVVVTSTRRDISELLLITVMVSEVALLLTIGRSSSGIPT